MVSWNVRFLSDMNSVKHGNCAGLLLSIAIELLGKLGWGRPPRPQTVGPDPRGRRLRSQAVGRRPRPQAVRPLKSRRLWEVVRHGRSSPLANNIFPLVGLLIEVPVYPVSMNLRRRRSVRATCSDVLWAHGFDPAVKAVSGRASTPRYSRILPAAFGRQVQAAVWQAASTPRWWCGTKVK